MRHKRVTVVVGGVVIETTHSFSLGYEEIKGKEKKRKRERRRKMKQPMSAAQHPTAITLAES